MSTLTAVGELFKQGTQVVVQTLQQIIPWSQPPAQTTEGSSHIPTPAESTQPPIENTLHAGLQSSQGLPGSSRHESAVQATARSDKGPRSTRNPKTPDECGNMPFSAKPPRTQDKSQQTRNENEIPIAAASRAQEDNYPAQNEKKSTVTKTRRRQEDSYQAQKETENPVSEEPIWQEDNYLAQNENYNSVSAAPIGQQDNYSAQNENGNSVSEPPVTIGQEDYYCAHDEHEKLVEAPVGHVDYYPVQNSDDKHLSEAARCQESHQPATTIVQKDEEYSALNTETMGHLVIETQARIGASVNEDFENDAKTDTTQTAKSNDESQGKGAAKHDQSQAAGLEACLDVGAHDGNVASSNFIAIPTEEYRALMQENNYLMNEVKRLTERPPSSPPGAQASNGAEDITPADSQQSGVVWIVPEIIHNDDRVSRPLRQLAGRVHEQLEIRSLPSSSITSSTGNVILPVIATSRVSGDVRAAMHKAKLDVGLPCVVLIFNHLAPHNSRIRTPTKDRLSERQVESCKEILDLVFWNGNMYDCEANTSAVHTLQTMWNISSDN